MTSLSAIVVVDARGQQQQRSHNMYMLELYSDVTMPMSAQATLRRLVE